MREDNYYSGKTYIWTYDKGGNILTKSEYAYTAGTLGEPLNTVNYSYGNSDWKDLLTEYNGTAINYDLSGNPLNWRNASSLTWDGRRLSGMTLTDGTELAFEYNSAGIRIGKTVGTDKTVEYLLDGTKIIREIRKVNGIVTETLLYYYNTDGDVIGLNYNGTDYYYGRNMQGDILYIYNTSGEAVTTYAYDAWGSIVSQTGTLSSTVGEANPFRYRGYYLDSETGLYYLQSRYYDAAVGRFLNADATEYGGTGIVIITYNLFAYCGNNPVNYIDDDGKLFISITTIIAIASVVAGIGAGAYVAYKSYKLSGKIDWVNAITSGLGVGLTVYSLGMTAYQAYQCVSMYYGRTPVTGFNVGKTGQIIGDTSLLNSAELRVANDLKEKGNKVEIIPRAKDKTPDFKVNGIKTELKTLQNPNINTGITRIKQAFKQGEHVIIDARNTSLTIKQAEEIINRAAGTYAKKVLPGLVEIWTKYGIVISSNKSK